MRLIDADLLKQNCKITGEFDNHFQCVDLITLGQVIDSQPTFDETEIIRKAFERVLQRLDKQAGEFIDLSHRELSNNSIPAIKYLNKGFGVARAIEIVKEECGISE